MGTKSEVDSRRAVRCFKAILKKIGFTSVDATYTIHNMVGTCDVSFPIRLEGICCEFTRESTVLIYIYIYLYSMNLKYFLV